MALWDEEIGEEPNYEADEASARQWAADLLAKPEGWIVLDCETTGVDYGSEPVEIAVVTPDGKVAFHSFVMPSDGKVPLGAVRVHGITAERLAELKAPPFAEIWPRLREALGENRLVVYNAVFDRMILRYALVTAGLGIGEPPNEWLCAMEMYAQWYGRWNSWHGSYTWQKLPHGRESKAHGAVSDCRAVLALLAKMAAPPATGKTLMGAGAGLGGEELVAALTAQRAADVAAGLPACRVCGCTQNASCTPPCYWVPGHENLCSACAIKTATGSLSEVQT